MKSLRHFGLLIVAFLFVASSASLADTKSLLLKRAGGDGVKGTCVAGKCGMNSDAAEREEIFALISDCSYYEMQETANGVEFIQVKKMLKSKASRFVKVCPNRDLEPMAPEGQKSVMEAQQKIDRNECRIERGPTGGSDGAAPQLICVDIDSLHDLH